MVIMRKKRKREIRVKLKERMMIVNRREKMYI
jgi:hypothetical protein